MFQSLTFLISKRCIVFENCLIFNNEVETSGLFFRNVGDILINKIKLVPAAKTMSIIDRVMSFLSPGISKLLYKKLSQSQLLLSFYQNYEKSLNEIYKVPPFYLEVLLMLFTITVKIKKKEKIENFIVLLSLSYFIPKNSHPINPQRRF